MATITAQIMEALSNGPKSADSLITFDRVRMFNNWHEQHKSHWRVRGEKTFDPKTGKKGWRYELTME